MKASRILYLLVCAIMLMALIAGGTGCGKKATPTPTPTKTVAPATATATPTPVKKIVIGITEDASGFNADAGKASRDGAILAIEEWNAKGGIKGTKIEYLFRDNAGDPTKATTIAKEFVDTKVTGAVMGTSSTVAIPESKLLTADKIPHVGGAASTAIFTEAPDGKWYYFSNCSANPALAECVLPHFAKNGYKRIAFFISNVAWPQDLRDQTKNLITKTYGPKYGMETVGEIAVDVNATDVTTEVLKLKAMKPDAVSAILYPVNINAYFSALNKVGYTPPPPSYDYWALMESVYMAAEKKILYGAVGYSNFSSMKPEFIKKKGEFMARFGYEPVGHFGFSYDGTITLLKAIDAAGTDGPAIRDWLETKAKGQPVITGRVGATANFTKESWHSLLDAEGFAFLSVDKDGKLIWE